METRTLDVELTKQEIAVKSELMTDVIQRLDAAEEARKTDAAAAREEIKGINRRLRELARSVRTGKESREVECDWRPDAEHGVFELVRLDTKAVVETRVMTAEELAETRQTRLPLKDVSAPPAVPKKRARKKAQPRAKKAASGPDPFSP